MAGIDDYTKLLLNFNGEDESQTFIDSSTVPKTVTAYGTAQIDTAQSKFGGASGVFDGDSDYLSIPSSTDFDLTADFTIEAWVRFASVANGERCNIYSRYVNATNQTFLQIEFDATYAYITIYFRTSGTVHAYYYTQTAKASIFAINTWYHIACVRYGNTQYIFVNGTAVSLNTITAWNGSIGALNTALRIGQNPIGDIYFEGHMDVFRVSKGIARWKDTFTPPTEEYSVPLNTTYWICSLTAPRVLDLYVDDILVERITSL